MKVAVVIGHNPHSKGAYSKYLKTNEFDYNSEVATHLKGFDIYRRLPIGSYKKQIINLAQQINPKKYDLVIELHFNAFNASANGVETVSFPRSKSIPMGALYCDMIANEYGTKNRGAKVATSDARGLYFLKTMNAPSLILEPFFGDAPEALKFTDTKKYSHLINEWFNKLNKL